VSHRRRVIILIAVFTVLRLAYIGLGPFDLSPDEAHYWEWSRRLGLSYYSKGPAVAYVIAFFTAVFGNTAFAVRLGAVVFSALSTYMVYLLGAELFGSERAGFWAALMAGVTPVFAAGAVLMTTDVLLVFFWAAAVYCIKKAVDGRGARWWYVSGLLVGVGFLGKYTMVLLYPCVLLFLIVSPAQRRWLKRFEPYIAAFISLLTVTPVILWNILHEQVTIKHTLGQVRAGGGGFSLTPMLEFLGSQAALITPVIFAGLVYGVWRAGQRGLEEDAPGPWLAFFASAPLFAFFLLKALFGKVQANWAVASYVSAFPAAAWAYAGLLQGLGRGARRGLRTAAAFGVASAALVSVLAYLPVLLEPVGFEQILDGPPYNRVTGWHTLGEKVSDAVAGFTRAGAEPPFIMSDTYQIASELAFYTPGNPVTYNVNTGSRRMNQYDLWPGLEGLAGRDALYVKGGVVEIEPLVASAFESCKREVFTIYRRERVLKEFSLFHCRGFRGMRPPGGGTRY